MTEASHPAVLQLLDDLEAGRVTRDEFAARVVERAAPADALDDVANTVEGLIAGIEEFKGVLGRSSDETAGLVLAAQRRFAIQLSATMLDAEPESDTQGSPTTSYKRLREELIRLSDRVADLVQSTIRDAQLRQELEIAGAVQRMLVPPTVVEMPGLRAASWFLPAEQCSGDWWNIARLGKEDVILMVGDVTGHGASAAIIAGTAKGALDMARVGMREALKPYMAMNMMNFILMESMKGEYFMSGVLARYEPSAKALRIANAGHRPPWIFRRSGTQTLPGDRSPPLGTSRGTKYAEQLVAFESGDILVVYTDGIPEAEDAEGNQLGERALRDVCEKASVDGPEAVCEAVRRKVVEHAGSLNHLGDDVTLLAVQAL